MKRPSVFAVFAIVALVSAAAAQDQALVAAGEQLYAEKCSECHGARLRNPGTSFDLKQLKANERMRFETSVMNGKGSQMPPWRGIVNEEQLGQLWAYIREYAYE